MPVSAGWLDARSLFDGTVDLADIAWLNDGIAVERANKARWAEWVKKHAPR